MSGVNYKLYGPKHKLLNDFVKYTCYVNVTQNSHPANLRKVVCYQDNIQYSVKEIKTWVAYMNTWGFPVKYLGMGSKVYGIEKKNHVFVIDMYDEEDKPVFTDKRMFSSTLMLLRYLYEDTEINLIPKHFFELLKELPDKDPFLVMQYAHTLIPFANGNHMLRRGDVMTFVTQDILKQRLEEMNVKMSSAISGNINALWAGKMLIVKKNRSNAEKFEKILTQNINVYVVGGNVHYANWIPNCTLVDNLKDADLAIFTGGEDVHPSLYDEPTGDYTSSNLQRDLEEKNIFLEARKLNIPMLGICRGSQFLCVMSGGKLVQHQQNPSFIHKLTTNYGEIYLTSTHHQAQFPFNLPYYDYNVWGYTVDASKYHLDGNNKEMIVPGKRTLKEVEICYYMRTKCLGIQGHPEMQEYLNDPKYAGSLEVLHKMLNTFLQLAQQNN